MQEDQLTWPDGTPKSAGNAFDLRTCPGLLAAAFRKQEAKSAAGRSGAASAPAFTYGRTPERQQ